VVYKPVDRKPKIEQY